MSEVTPEQLQQMRNVLADRAGRAVIAASYLAQATAAGNEAQQDTFQHQVDEHRGVCEAVLARLNEAGAAVTAAQLAAGVKPVVVQYLSSAQDQYGRQQADFDQLGMAFGDEHEYTVAAAKTLDGSRAWRDYLQAAADRLRDGLMPTDFPAPD